MIDNATRDRKAAATEARKEAHRQAQDARRQANVAELGNAYNPRAVTTQMRWRRTYEGKTPVLKLVPVTVSLSPSKQLNRWRFQNGSNS